MKPDSQNRYPQGSVAGRRSALSYTLATAFALFALSAAAAVDIAQKPLTVQEPLEPNILFILDDSGSMKRDYMPDFISGVSTSDINDSEREILRHSGENLIYYDPNTSYLPPFKADGVTRYPDQTNFPTVDKDPFNASTTDTVDIADYEGQTHNGTLGSSGNRFDYGKKVSGSSFFIYTTKSGGTYTEHFVAATSADCAKLTATEQANCAYDSATRTNVANWFSFYRSRQNLAKSSTMTAFKDLNEDYRLGYGELNGSEKISSPAGSATKVAVFGDGSTGTRKEAFFDWLAANTSNSGTPLQLRLDNAGKYFETDQPWLTDPADGSSDKYACRQSFTILTSDGYWNGTEVNVGDQDNTNGPTITGPNSLSYTYSAAAPYALDTTSSQENLADIAMKYWKNDLKTTISNEVPTSDEDPAFWQHMVTFTVGLGLEPTDISPSSATIDDIFDWANGGTAISNFSWPIPVANSSKTVSDMAHAAVNGHGGFYSAKNPEEFTQAISDALSRASNRIGSAASLAANSTKLDVGTFSYQASYFTGEWKGDLKSYAVDATSGLIATNATWSANDQLPAHGSRNLKTYNPTSNSYVAFSDPAALDSAQKTALGANATAQQNLINWMRGDDSNEQSNGGSLRDRTAILGDIVNSQPVYVGKPYANLYANKTFTGQGTYVDFATDNITTDGDAVSPAATRDPIIYVAGNDGYLHGFNAATGVEVYGYMPAAVILQGFGNISNPDYGIVDLTTNVPHKFYNDGELTVADAYFTTASSWKTVLVGTTGRGNAKSVYALDITDPTNIQFLWERYAADGKTNSNYIGQVAGKPVIAQTGDGVWTVLMGNGYNSTENKAALLQFDIDDGDLTVHTTNTTTDNGLAAPIILDVNNDGFQERGAAGDLFGNVWSFTNLSTATAGTSVFIAKDSNNNTQPITAGMLAGIDPDTSDLWLFFGTGQYLKTADVADVSTQSWYGIIINSSLSTPLKLLSTGRSSLKQRQIAAEVAATSTTLAARGFSKGADNDMTDDNNTTSDLTDDTRYAGWYMDLTSPTNGAEGERMTTANQFQGKTIIGTSRIPDAVDPCNTTGRGWVMALNPFTGTNVFTPFFDFNNDNDLSTDYITVNGVTYAVGGVGFDALPNNPIFIGNKMLINFDDGTSASIDTSGGVGAASRESWRELFN